MCELITMAKNTRQIIFILQAAFDPTKLHKCLECCRSSRQTDTFPIWWRIDGNGFTLWLSELILADSTATPPTWHVKLESLAALPPSGIQQWDMTVTTIEQFLKDEKIAYTSSIGENCNA